MPGIHGGIDYMKINLHTQAHITLTCKVIDVRETIYNYTRFITVLCQKNPTKGKLNLSGRFIIQGESDSSYMDGLMFEGLEKLSRGDTIRIGIAPGTEPIIPMELVTSLCVKC